MAINLIDWIEQYDTQEQKSKYKIIACEEGHSTSLDEMDRLGTHGFCPKCSLPITNEADESYTRMLEAYAENAMVTRDHFIRT